MKNQTTEIETVTLSAKEDLFRLMLNNIDESFVLLDRNFCIIESNRAARSSVLSKAGLPLLPGEPYLAAVAPEQIPIVKAILADVLNGHRYKHEYACPLHDQVLYFENNFMPAMKDPGKVVGVVVYIKDITEKKQAEIAIREAEERWQTAFEVSNQAGWEWNMQTDEIIYSNSYKKMYGFIEDELSNDVSEWYGRIHPEDKKKIEQDLQKHLYSEQSLYETTYRLQLKNGSYKWILARGKLLGKDASGRPLRMIGTHTDLTEKMETEEAIKKMNERFLFASKASAQALWEWDALSGQAYVSPSFTEIFGWEADEENHFEQWHQYVHPDDKKQTISGYYHTLDKTSDSIWQAEYRFLKQDGSYATVSDKAFILRDEDGKPLKVIGATQDITAKKQIEEELFRSNERFNLMMEATNDLLWEWDMASKEVYRSMKAIKKVYGLDDDTLVKTHEQWLQRIHPEDRPRVSDAVASVFTGKNKQHFEIEYRFLGGNNTYHYLHGRGILLTDDNGIPVRMIGTEQNISERKLLEQELLKNELAYKKLINQATVDSQEQERSEIGRELHDNINQVLTTTKLYLDLAASNPDLEKELVKKANRNISSVINEIRQLSRSLMDPTIGDLGIVDSINDLIENIHLTRKININLQIDETIENHLDGNQKLTIFRILQESLNNVIRHAKANRVTISIQLQKNRIGLIIKDDGIGFSQDSIKKGAGLKNITNRVYLINGDFQINSKPGHGCEILINFPIK